MAFTISFTSLLESSETLARRTLTRLYAAWSSTQVSEQIVSVPYATTVALVQATTYVFQADPIGSNSIVVGWVYQANIVELPLNQLTVIKPPATPYLRNTSVSTTSTPVPVRVVSFS